MTSEASQPCAPDGNVSLVDANRSLINACPVHMCVPYSVHRAATRFKALGLAQPAVQIICHMMWLQCNQAAALSQAV